MSCWRSSRVGAQVQQGQRGLRGGGVDAAGDEVPEDVEQLFVGEALAVEFELDEEAGQVVAGLGAPFGREVQDVLHHGGDLGDGVDVFGAVLGDGHDGVEEVGVELPVVVGQAHHFHGEDGRDRAGVVEHEVHLSVGDFLVEELVGLFLHERLHLVDGARREERGQRVPQRQVVGAVDLADAQCRLAFGTWDAHLALVVDAVCGVGFVSVGEGVVVAGGLAHRGVAAEEPEAVVVLVPRDRAFLAQLGVDRALVAVEFVGVVVEVDYCVVGDVGTGCHLEGPPPRRELGYLNYLCIITLLGSVEKGRDE